MARYAPFAQSTLRLIALSFLLLVWGCGDGGSPTGPDPSQNRVGIDGGGTSGQGGGQGAAQGKAPFIVVLGQMESPAAVAHDHDITPKRTFTRVLNGFAGDISEAARSGLLRDARVVKVERDEAVSIADAEVAASWGLDRIDQRSPDLDGLYEYQQTGAGVTVYVVDTGIRYSHEEFEGRARFGFDAFGGDGADCHGHGTHVAGTVGGRRYGVAKSVNLVSVRVLDCDGWGYISDILAGLDWVAENHAGPSVANMSLTSSTKLGTLDEGVDNLIAAGVTVAVAAGNFHGDACDYSPARVRNAITIGSSGKTDARSQFSNWGPCVDWFAPGEGILSASVGSDTDAAIRSGTSMATPHAAGVAALFLELDPSASPAEVAATLADWTTKGVIQDANSKNDDLLFSLGLGTGGEPPAPENASPIAGFSYLCEGLECSFLDESVDPDGTIAGWTWEFGAEGQSAAANPAFTFGQPGTYVVDLTVVDDGGARGSASRSVTVSSSAIENQVPSAWFSVSCEDLTCQFKDESYDTDGSIVAWSWDFGLGSQASTSAAAFTFGEPGTYSVTLSVWDDDGAANSVSRDVTVSSAPENQVPSAWFSAFCEALTCQFTDESFDADGSIVAWSWDFGLGSQASTSAAAFTFGAQGTYSVTLRVWDDLGAEDSVSRDVTVSLDGGGILLTATGLKLKGQHVVDLVWSGASGSDVSLFRDGVPIGILPNTGSHTDTPDGHGKATYVYQVCETDGLKCSAEVLVSF